MRTPDDEHDERAILVPAGSPEIVIELARAIAEQPNGSVVLGREKDVPSGGFLVLDEGGAMTDADWARLRAAVDTPLSGVFRASVAWDIYKFLRQQPPHLADWEHPAPE